MTIINDETLLYSQDELKFRDRVREFVDQEVKPIADDVEANAPWPEKNWREFMLKLGKEGFTGLMIPKKYGGEGKTLTYQIIAGEEISVLSPALTMYNYTYLPACKLYLRHFQMLGIPS